MPRGDTGRKRCAIYTRKSSEEGLEQEFNSLAAQREACEAFICSQRHKGWVLARNHYDDGEFSGGNLERPALQRLLDDIRAGRIDIVVVYKGDRLTRSLADFARLVELFDAKSVSFAVAGMLHFAIGFHRAATDRDAGAFDHRAYRPLLLQGKTACVVGAGGIGTEVGRLCAALGMRVVGTRRQPQPGAPLPQGFSEIGGPEALDRFLPQSDFVAICCQWTPETTRLFDKDRFAAMKAGSVLVNVARGEIVDEEALLDALERGHLRGAALDVYVGEFEHAPMPLLWSDRRVLITPHISNASDQNHHGGVDVFCNMSRPRKLRRRTLATFGRGPH
jgi:D-isomer specific 2-hydroxyacid dehydrogenase, NAD binding domain/Resolvase, N terminal domain